MLECGLRTKFTMSATDELFILFYVLKPRRTSDLLATTFRNKAPTFERTIMSFLEVVQPIFYDDCVNSVEKDNRMRALVERSTMFDGHPYSRYATDGNFQQTNRPLVNIQEFKYYFSGKHQLYGSNVEVSVIIPAGVAIGHRYHYPGSDADI